MRPLFEPNELDFGSLTEDKESKEKLSQYIAEQIETAKENKAEIAEQKRIIFHNEQEKSRLEAEVNNLRQQKDSLIQDIEKLKNDNEAYTTINEMEQHNLTEARIESEGLKSESRKDREIASKERAVAEKVASEQQILLLGNQVSRQLITSLIDDANFYKAEEKKNLDKTDELLDEATSLSRESNRILDELPPRVSACVVKEKELQQRESKLKDRESMLEAKEESLIIREGEFNKLIRRNKLDQYREGQ